MDRNRIMPTLAVTALLLPVCADGAVDRCAPALTETGRNQLLSISRTDTEAYHYRKSCGSTATQAELTAAVEAFEVAKRSLGFGFSTREEYCHAQEDSYKNYQFNYLATSTVVEKALDSWLACIRLDREGIVLTPEVQSTRLILTLRRSGAANSVVRGVSATAATVCKGHLMSQGKSKSSVLGPNINFALPPADSWVVICDRASQPSLVAQGRRYYPETNVTLDTTEGAFPITLPEEPLAAEVWATAIRRRIDKLSQDMAQLEKGLKDTRPLAVTDIGVEPCGAPPTAAPSGFIAPGFDDFRYACPAGCFLQSMKYGKQSGGAPELDMRCVKPKIERPK